MKEKLYRVLKKQNPKERPTLYGEFYDLAKAEALKEELKACGVKNIMIKKYDRPFEGEE